MKIRLLIIVSIICMQRSVAQDAVGINNDSPHASAILDITSTDKGVLVPRMTTGQRNAISSPATGLLVYDNTTNTFWYFNSNAWTEIVSSVSSESIADADDDTKIQVEESNDEDIIRFDMSGTEYFRMNGPRLEFDNSGNSVFLGQNAGQNDDGSTNNLVYVGHNAGRQNTTGSRNVGLGYRALQQNTVGNDNVAVGEDALRLNTSGSFNIAVGANALDAAGDLNNNTAIGYSALTNLSLGSDNVAIGLNAHQDLTNGSSNVAVGGQALQNNVLGSQNTAIGRQAGQNAPGNGNIFIGYQAGRNESGNNKLYIESSSSTTPLIYGDFAADSVVIHGDEHVTGNITYIGTITDVSDRRLKENIQEVNSVLEELNQLQAYSYNLIENEDHEREYGLIAQEVQKLFPEMVKHIHLDQDYLGVSYVQLIPILIQALKEQQMIIQNQNDRIDASELKLNQLNAEVDKVLKSSR